MALLPEKASRGCEAFFRLTPATSDGVAVPKAADWDGRIRCALSYCGL